MNELETLRENLLTCKDGTVEKMIARVFKNIYSLAAIWPQITELRLADIDTSDVTDAAVYVNRIHDLEEQISNKDHEISMLQLTMDVSGDMTHAKQIADATFKIADQNDLLRSTIIEKDDHINTLNDKIKKLEEQLNKKVKGQRFNSDTGHTYNDVSDQTIIDMYNMKVPVKDIASKTGMTYHGVRKRLIKTGVWVEKVHGGQKKY